MSLRLRLALWYGVLASLVVVFVAILTYALHTRGHYDDLDYALVTITQHVREEYEAAPTEAVSSIQTAGTPGFILRLYSPDGRVLAATPGAALGPAARPDHLTPAPPFDFLVGLAPPLRPVRPEPGVLGLGVGADGARWRLYALPLADGNLLLGATSLEHADAAAAWFRRLVPLVAAAGAAAACSVGYLIAGNAVRPVRVLTEAARAIGDSGDFTRRVPEPGRRDELGELAATFNAMLASLQEAYRAQQRFVADASHELRAPLTVIQANLDLLRRYQVMPAAERDQAIAQAEREAGRLARLVGDLLTLARADAGVGLRRWPVELDRLVLEAVTEAGRVAGGRQLEVDWVEPVLVEGDPDRLKQMVLILLDNAVKYTPEGGRISVRLRRDGQTAELEVRDTGVGIEPAELPHVFDRFFRGEAARQLDPDGTGLGLPIARWVVRQHGGEITLESQPNKGTAVRVRLPLRG